MRESILDDAEVGTAGRELWLDVLDLGLCGRHQLDIAVADLVDTFRERLQFRQAVEVGSDEQAHLVQQQDKFDWPPEFVLPVASQLFEPADHRLGIEIRGCQVSQSIGRSSLPLEERRQNHVGQRVVLLDVLPVVLVRVSDGVAECGPGVGRAVGPRAGRPIPVFEVRDIELGRESSFDTGEGFRCVGGLKDDFTEAEFLLPLVLQEIHRDRDDLVLVVNGLPRGS